MPWYLFWLWSKAWLYGPVTWKRVRVDTYNMDTYICISLCVYLNIYLFSIFKFSYVWKVHFYLDYWKSCQYAFHMLLDNNISRSEFKILCSLILDNFSNYNVLTNFWLVVIFCNSLHLLGREISLIKAED